MTLPSFGYPPLEKAFIGEGVKMGEKTTNVGFVFEEGKKSRKTIYWGK